MKETNAHIFYKNVPPFIGPTGGTLPEPEHSNAFSTLAYLYTFPLDRSWNCYAKRLIDFVLSTILILGIFPWLLPLIAIIIKSDSKGPVFFLQKRNKINGHVFTCIKFRSMLVNREADHLPAIENDQRITRCGKFLRDHHLDELPQLFNVWMGDMSLVGPRPHMISDNLKFEVLVHSYHYRHKVKPGITGLAQVTGYVGPVTDTENLKERVAKDIYYINNWSFVLDFKIACQTIWRIFGIRKAEKEKIMYRLRKKRINL